MKTSLTRLLRGLALAGGGLVGGCSPQAADPDKIRFDGSSTVFPITEAVVEEFARAHPGLKVTVGLSGTGGGFKKFSRGDIDLANASRPITPKEAASCAAQGIGYDEIAVAYDGLAVVVNPRNTWATSLTVAELKKLWEPAAQGRIKRWSQVRAGWPDEEIHLFGAGVASGTYDYFTQAIVGTAHASRGDYTASEDDNVLVQGISTDRLALGFFGLAYYEENMAKLKLVPVDDERADNGAGPILPSPATVTNKTYAPLARPLFIYVTHVAAQRAPVQTLVRFYLDHAGSLAREVGYVAMAPEEYRQQRAQFDRFAADSTSVTPAAAARP